jgi:purine-cytosine permease-like protein
MLITLEFWFLYLLSVLCLFALALFINSRLGDYNKQTTKPSGLGNFRIFAKFAKGWQRKRYCTSSRSTKL